MNNKRNKAGRPPLCISLLLDIAVINFSTRSLEDLRDKFIRQLCRILSNNNFGSRFRELEHAKKIKVDGIGYLPDYLKIQLEDIPKKKRKFTKKKINEMNDKIFQFQNQVIEVYANCLLGGNFDENYLSRLFKINLIPEIDDIETRKEIWTCLVKHLSLAENDKESITKLENKINELRSTLSNSQITPAGNKSTLNESATNQSFDIEMCENNNYSNSATLSTTDRLNLDKSTCNESSSSIKKSKLSPKKKSREFAYKEDMGYKISFSGIKKQKTEGGFGSDEEFFQKAHETPQDQIEQSNPQQGIIIQDRNDNQDDMDLDMDEKPQEDLLEFPQSSNNQELMSIDYCQSHPIVEGIFRDKEYSYGEKLIQDFYCDPIPQSSNIRPNAYEQCHKSENVVILNPHSVQAAESKQFEPHESIITSQDSKNNKLMVTAIKKTEDVATLALNRNSYNQYTLVNSDTRAFESNNGDAFYRQY